MEWSMPVNEMLRDDITKISSTLVPPDFKRGTQVNRLTHDMSRLIDEIGEQSAAAQGLDKVITTADKLRNAPTHVLYLAKDAHAKGGAGEVIGMLKIGSKHLFLYDDREKIFEVESLCVLDFFVVQDRQRRGVGRALFDFMLRDQNVRLVQLAIDGPSPKMEQFLRKHYGVECLLRQNNKFAVAPEFFSYHKGISSSGRSTASSGSSTESSGRTTPSWAEGGSMLPRRGRFAAARPRDTVGSVIHGKGDSVGNDVGAAGAGGNAPSHHHGTSSEKRRAQTLAAPEEARLPPEAIPEQPVEEELAPVVEETPAVERPNSLRVDAAAAPAQRDAAAAPARRDSQLTDRGYFDVKFYHNKLCCYSNRASLGVNANR